MLEISVAYLDARGRLREVPAAEASGVPIEELPPVAPPVAHRGRRGFVTDAWVSTTGRVVSCGSLREQRVAMALDRDSTIAAFSACPVELRWDEGGRHRALRPDFGARRHGGERLLLLVELQTPGAVWERRRHILEEAALRTGWELEVTAPATGTELANLQLVFGARDPRGRDPGAAQALLSAFARPRRLEDGAAACGLPRLAAIELAHHLIWHRQLEIDWHAPLLPTSPVWASGVRP
ncbi:TnsA-like heteromeric transposase endonuclease subunit [Embleya hyalina]|uniref:TnsA endonuclease N-terminal domain-containing protein n=1 Tax=Embleya hyalina TaxID=516124 RepID=A0A401Z4T2_9ACTN|nr:TnsA-like heteromeric transposase endonuclease subunit [Embleya hyalina]GCE01845.1 hypothetical protein EHYA_09619 [Embleya hyalina]